MKRFVGKKIKLRHKVLLGIYLFSIIVYSLAWFLKPAVDFYRLSVFPLWTNTFARVMSLFPFSVGEILIYIGIFLLFVA